MERPISQGTLPSDEDLIGKIRDWFLKFEANPLNPPPHEELLNKLNERCEND